MLEQTKLYGWTFLLTGIFLTASMLTFLESEGNRILISHFPIFIAGPIICSISLSLLKPFTKRVFLIVFLSIILGGILFNVGLNNTISNSIYTSFKDSIFNLSINNQIYREGSLTMIIFLIVGLCLIFLGVTEILMGIVIKYNKF